MSKWPKRAQKTINELAWQGAIQFAIKVCDMPINLTAADCMRRPRFWGKRGPAYAPYLRFFAQCRISGVRRDELGSYRNKMAVVYTISVLEQYLKQVYKDRSWPSPKGGRTFGKYFYDVKNKMSGRWKDMCAIDGVAFLLEIRNAIIHSFGKTDTNRKRTLRKLRDRNSWPDCPTQNEPQFDKDFRGKNLCLDIIKVVIPGLKRSVEYVMEVERALKR